jgi:DNA-binding XRE family transcriptional regulator
VITIERHVVHAPLPASYTEIDAVIERHEADSRRAAALGRARQRLAEQLLVNGGPITLAALRLHSGYSQATLAARMGTSQPTYSKIEAGKVDVALSTMEKLADALSVGLDQMAIAMGNTRKAP